MKRKQLQYPEYNSFRRLRHEEMIFNTRFAVLRFFPKDEFTRGGIVLYKSDRRFIADTSFPATEDGYKAAIAASDEWINKCLDRIEQEFYEVDE